MSTVYDNPALVNTVGDRQWSEGDAFTGVQYKLYWSDYWSNTEHLSGYAWFVNMSLGIVDYDAKPMHFYVWPVRSDN